MENNINYNCYESDNKESQNSDYEKYKVSIIIPTYKRNLTYLERAIRSVLNQTYKNIEIIVVDDSPNSYKSRHEISNFMKKLCTQNSKVKYIMNEINLGGSLARNIGINFSTGEFITFLDDDDEYKPEKIKTQINFMIETECDMSFSNMIMYDSKRRIVDSREYSNIKCLKNDYLLKYHLMYHLTGTPTFMYKATKLREIGGFEDAKMGQEFFLMLKTIEKGLNIAYLNVCNVIVYKHNDGSISQGKNKIIGENNLYEFKKKYFNLLNNKEKRFVRFRHYAVMAIAYKRNKELTKMICAICKSFFYSPMDFIMQLLLFIKKIISKRVNKKGN